MNRIRKYLTAYCYNNVVDWSSKQVTLKNIYPIQKVASASIQVQKYANL